MGKTKQEDNFSNNVYWYNFILCILVVFIHARNDGAFTVPVVIFGSSIFNEMESFFAVDIAGAAVGGFYLCSGYLFFRSYSWSQTLAKYKSRVHSILIPYVLWTLIYFFIHVLISRIPSLAAIFQEAPIALTWQSILDAVLNYRYCAFLWFLQFLIFYAAISPVIYLLIQNRHLGAAAILMALFTACTNIIKNGQAAAVLNWMVLYMLGGYLGVHYKTVIESKKVSTKFLLGTCVLAFAAFWIRKGFPGVFGVLFYSFAFAAALWCLTAWEKGNGKDRTMPVVRDWQKNTFAVYMTHFMLVQGANAIISKFVSQSMWAGIILFFSLPVICFGAAALAKKICRDGNLFLWKILMGSR